MPRFPNRIRFDATQLPNKSTTILPIGISIPFNNPNGVFYQTFTNVDQVRANLKNLLLTAKGERYLLPDFGTDIRWLLFENISDETSFREQLTGTITDAIGTWMPYLSLSNFNVKFNVSDDGRIVDPKNAVTISFDVNIIGSPSYFPIRIFIADDGAMRIIEAIYNE